MKKQNLVIVESPAKAKTIEKILGNSFEVVASYGHVRDLPKTTLGIKIEEDFKANYSIPKDKKELVEKLRIQSKGKKIYLASDPDREGEAIAWHISKTLKLKDGELNRIEFNEITKTAVLDSMKNVRVIDMRKVEAQQARRILDRIVGYKISPLLWTTISENTSAGRVQSVALKIICDLEDKIKAFIPEKYWDVKGFFKGGLELKLNEIDKEKFELLKDEKVVNEIKSIKNGEMFRVTSAKVSKRKKTPPNPLKTSTLQQLASSYLGFSATRTMRVAQGLYEGIEIFGEQKGLITYMRTDSIRISEEAKEMAKKYILSNFGEEYTTKDKKENKKKKEKIQDAHEAVRPSDINLTPEKIKGFLSEEQYKLYSLIWERFLISQMANMEYEQFEVMLSHGKFAFRGSINKIIFDGYYKVFKDEEELPLGDFPSIKEGDEKELIEMDIKEDFTKAPNRITESSLVKKLEQEGIGRPSTYATIVETLKKREYVILEGRSFIPTELGYDVKKELEENFPEIMNIKFTAHFEEELDDIAEGKLERIEVLKEFYTGLEKNLEKYSKKVDEIKNRRIESDVKCSCSDVYMVMKLGIFGKYIACEDENCKENISLKGIDVPKNEILSGKIYVAEKIKERDKGKIGVLTDVIAENGAKCLLKIGRFGSYLESENYKNDQIRISLPNSIKKLLISGEIKEENGVIHLANEIKKIKDEEIEILKNAGNCNKCGLPYKVNRGRWGKFLTCTGYPSCKNIQKLDKENRIIKEDEKEKKNGSKKSKSEKTKKVQKTSKGLKTKAKVNEKNKK